MSEKTCVQFLLQIFEQCFMSENFYHLTTKLGINFSLWPDRPYFEKAKRFYSIAKEKSYTSALIEIEHVVSDEAYKKTISEEEIRIYYEAYLGYLRSLELINNLRKDPESAVKLCTDFLTSKESISTRINLHDAVMTFVEDNEEKLKSKVKNINLTAMPCLSKLIGGFNPGRVIMITAFTGYGKTNWGINFLKFAMRDGFKSLYINMEMDTVDMTKRYLQSEFALAGYEFERDSYISRILPAASNEVLKENWITDGSAMSINEITNMVSTLKRKQSLDFVIVDYDQKIIMEETKIKEEWQAVRKAVEMLEAMAKREKVCVIMFAQTNEEREGLPIASARAMQPTSAVIHFTREGAQSVLKFIKNRFGPTGDKIKLIYDPSKSLIQEDGMMTEVLPKPEMPGFKKRF